jgi:hypothetical protein
LFSQFDSYFNESGARLRIRLRRSLIENSPCVFLNEFGSGSLIEKLRLRRSLIEKETEVASIGGLRRELTRRRTLSESQWS